MTGGGVVGVARHPVQHLYLFVAQCGRGLEGRRGAQAAQGPGLADLGWLQRPTADGAEAAQVRQMSGRPNHAERLPFHRLQRPVSVVATAHIV